MKVPLCDGVCCAVLPYVLAVTPEFASVAATDHPAFEDAVPVTSPVSVIDWAEANSVADEALPVKEPVKVDAVKEPAAVSR